MIKIRKIITGNAADMLLLRAFIMQLRYVHEEKLSKDMQDSLEILDNYISEKVDQSLFEGDVD
mgnify:CR=1 FL=1